MSLTITPTRCEIYSDELEAVIVMNDSYTSTVTIQAIQSPSSWRDLAEAVQAALAMMNKEEPQ